MFILAKEKSVRLRDVIGVFDLDTATVSNITKNFLAGSEKSGEVEGTENLPKSFILASVGARIARPQIKARPQNKIYLSSRLANYINK